MSKTRYVKRPDGLVYVYHEDLKALGYVECDKDGKALGAEAVVEEAPAPEKTEDGADLNSMTKEELRDYFREKYEVELKWATKKDMLAEAAEVVAAREEL